MIKVFGKYAVACCLLGINTWVIAQINLVPNPSFEEYTDCPTGVPDLEGKCNNWTPFRGTPDYFNNCSPIVGFNNPFGYQVARTGNAYAGFGNFQKTISNMREQVGVELLSQLEIGIKYFISFHVSSAYTYLLVNIASNKIGAVFTTYQYDDPNLNYPLFNSCHVVTNTIITDTMNWVKISGSFVADSAYRYLVIGGFFDDQHIDTIHFPYQVVSQVSYYYLDDVCVSTDSVYTETWTSIKETARASYDLTLSPNPSTGLVQINSSEEIESIKITNVKGEAMQQMQAVGKHHQLIDLSVFPSGIYFCIIKLQNGYSTLKKLVLNH